jgi:hypothetical protein
VSEIKVDIGDICVYCGADTSEGSGRFVNRIPAEINADLVHDGLETPIETTISGFMCDECQSNDEPEPLEPTTFVVPVLVTVEYGDLDPVYDLAVDSETFWMEGQWSNDGASQVEAECGLVAVEEAIRLHRARSVLRTESALRERLGGLR